MEADLSRVTLEVQGLNELQALAEKMNQLAAEMLQTARLMDNKRLELQMKINQPPAGTNG